MPAPSRALASSAAISATAAVLAARASSRPARIAFGATAGIAGAVAANEAAGKPVPFLRWSFLRLMVGMKHLLKEWQVGDGREEALAAYVEEHARAGDIDDVIRVIDEFSRQRSILINVGDEKGEILDAAIRTAAPKRLLELGTYCGYGSLRMARAAGPGAHVHTVEVAEANAAVARRVHAHAGAGDRITVVVGSIADDKTVRELAESGFAGGGLDLVFLDHAKEAYVADLQRIVAEGWLHPGSVAVADNVGFPGAPEYRALMRDAEGTTWRTTEHKTHVEYQSVIKDLVLESTYLG